MRNYKAVQGHLLLLEYSLTLRYCSYTIVKYSNTEPMEIVKKLIGKIKSIAFEVAVLLAIRCRCGGWSVWNEYHDVCSDCEKKL